jgi:hypothetical protein
LEPYSATSDGAPITVDEAHDTAAAELDDLNRLMSTA